MPGSAPFQRHTKRPGQVLLLLTGMVSMLMMPVDYRGGADISHPHATAQLLIDLSHGALDHHGGDSRFGHWLGRHRRQLSPNRPAQHRLAPDPARSWMSPVSPDTIASLLSQIDAAALASDDDSPSLSTRSTAVEKLLLAGALLPGSAVVLWRRPSFRFHLRQRLGWRGLLPAPEPPPPRIMAP